MLSKADVIIENAKIFTSNPDEPWAEAVVINGNKIIYVGTIDGAENYKDSSTRVVDGEGRTVTAGFIDTHVHLLSGAIWMGYAQLPKVKTIDELKSILLDYAEKNITDQWIIGRGIKYGVVDSRQQLDEIQSDRPIFVEAYDGHTSWVNTKALEMAGVLEDDGREMENGIIVRDAQGLATGELREIGAIDPVLNLIPKPDSNRKRELLKLAIDEFNKSGITCVHSMNGGMEDLMQYAALEDAGEMNLRVYVPYHVKPETSEDDLKEAGEMAKVQMDYVRGGAAKFFMDGVWESYTAFNVHPYTDNPEIGIVDPIFSLDHFVRMASICDKMGLQIAVHCCGDAAVRQTLDGFEQIQKINGKRDSRHRVEHIEVCQPEDIPRFKELGVIASMQTSHSPSNTSDDVWTKRVGKDRWGLSFAWRSIKNEGALLCFGSDWTVAPFDIMLNMDAGLNRKKWMESDPDQRLTLEELIIGYTRDAAYVEFKENEKGQIKEGYLADIIMFSHDLFEMNPEDIMSAKPILTMIDGRIVYEA